MSDSVSIFAEGTFEEQVKELVEYLARGLVDDERVSFIRPFQDALLTTEGKLPASEDKDRQRQVISMILNEVKTLGDGSESQTEGFFNLLLSHILSLFLDTPESKEKVSKFITAVVSSTATTDQLLIKYRILSNLYNTLPRQSPLRLNAYQALLNLASSNDELEVLQIEKSDIGRWIDEWDITSEEKRAFLKSLSDAYEKAGEQEIAYSYQLSYLRSLPPSSPDVQTAALEVIASALRLPAIFNFESLLKLEPLQAVKTHDLFGLLKIFLNGGLAEYTQWEAKNGATLDKFNLKKETLQKKIRYLTLTSLCTRHIGRELPYSVIASTLQIEEKDVEAWVIDVIRANLISGKLSQPARTLYTTRSTSREFGKEEWQDLEKKLLVWKAGLLGVLDVVAAARKTVPSGSAPVSDPDRPAPAIA
jgi:translation initiation factor 3 subunit M